jgi:uncharacterized protein YbaR (Trm112 family)
MQQTTVTQSKSDTAVPSGVPVDIMACPRCKGVLVAEMIDSEPALKCATCKLAYPIRDGIPLMLQDEAVDI